MKLTMNSVFAKLRSYHKKDYFQFLFCVTLSIVLITSFAVMFYNPLVQHTLPEGGDSRKQVTMLFSIALIGCFIFILYSANLFLKYKSKETGVFLALGAKKRGLTKVLVTEMAQLMLGCSLAGWFLGGILAFGIWQIFILMLPDAKYLSFHFSLRGFGLGVAFSLAAFLAILFLCFLYMRRTNMMDILYADKKNEPLRTVTKAYGISGIVLLFTGFLLGYGLPQIAGNFGKKLPGITSVLYLLSVVGIYRILTYSIVHSHRGKNPKRYYRTIISSSMMKFQGQQTVRNMCIIALLLAAGLFAGFYPVQLSSTVNKIQESSADMALHYNATENELGKKELYQLAKKHHVTLTKYQEFIFSELSASGVERDWTDDGDLIEKYQENLSYADFLSASMYQRITHKKLKVPKGGYYFVKSPEQADGFFDKFSDLDQVTNAETNQKLSVNYAGTIDCQKLINNGNQRYVLNDEDYQAISQGATQQHQTKQIFVNVDDLEASYPYAKAVYQAFIDRASPKMAVTRLYDEQRSGRENDDQKMDNLNVDNPDLMEYWKYYPVMKIMVKNTFIQNFAVFLLVFIYIAIICLVAVGVISYTRSITIALTNKRLFDDLQRLGANSKYIQQCIKQQLNKLFVIPTAIAIVLICTFSIMMFKGNDGLLSGSEKLALLMDLGIVAAVCLYQWLIYRYSFKKIKRILAN